MKHYGYIQDIPELSSLLSSVNFLADFSLNVNFHKCVIDFPQFNSRNKNKT